MRDPLLPPMAALASGVLIDRLLPFNPADLWIPLAAFVLLAVLGLWRGYAAAGRISCLAGFAATGILSSALHRMPPPPQLDQEGLAPMIVSGCVVEPPAFSEQRERFVLELEPGARARVSLYLRDGEAPPALAYGQKVEVEGRVRHPHNFGNPGAFDRVRYLARRDIYWTISSRPRNVTVLPGQCGSRAAAALFGARGFLLSRIERLYQGRPYETGMMKALLLGDDAQLERIWKDEFRRTGTLHALVISGSHVSVLAAFLMLLLRLLQTPRRTAATLTVAMAWGYALLTGWQAPVVRSAAGFSVFLGAALVVRRGRILNALAAAAIGFLLLDPEQLFEASFQLSFLAVAFLGAVAAPVLGQTLAPYAGAVRRLGDLRRDLRLPPRAAQFRVELRLLAATLSLWTRLPVRVANPLISGPFRVAFFVGAIALTSAVVQAGLALPMAIYFHRFPVSGLSANVVVVPVMTALVPIGLVALLTGWGWLGALAALLLGWARAAVQWHAAWEPRWAVPDPPLWLVLAVSTALVAAALAWHTERHWRMIPAGLALALLALTLAHPFPPRLTPGVLELTAVDVGQGDGLFLAFPNGRTMLMDSGGIATFGKAPPPRLDIGEDVVAPYLWSRAIRRLDVVAISHTHADHIGGLPAILEDFDVGELWTGATPESPEWARVREAARRRGVPIIAMASADTREIGGVRIEALAPLREYVAAAVPKNNDSLVLRLSYGRRSFLLAGDIERAIETQLAAAGAFTPVDVLKVAHHGSKTSSLPFVLDQLRPQFALVSAGFENSYGHPHPELLARFAERGTAVLRTDRHGLLTIRTDGSKIEMETGLWTQQSAGLEAAFDH